jgi:SIR2-like domain
MELQRPPSHENEVKRGELVDYVRDTDLVVVAGSGVSMQSVGHPDQPNTAVASWPGLLRHGLDYCKTHGLINDDDTEVIELQLKKKTTRNLIDAARQIFDWLERRPGNAKFNWLKESVGQLKIHDDSLIKALADLGGLLATLNYDGLHTDVTGRIPLHWKQLLDVDEQLRRKSRDFIFHIHGWWERPESIVFDSRSYYEISNDKGMKDLMRDFARFRSLLFVGCAGTFFDPNFSMLLTWANEALRSHRHRHFVLCRACDETALHSELQQCGMLEALVYGHNFGDLVPFLRKVGEDAGRTVAAANPPVATSIELPSPSIQKPSDVWKAELK